MQPLKPGLEAPSIMQLLSINGDGTGTTNAVGNYTTPTPFYIQPAAGIKLKIGKLLILITDASAMDGITYGGIPAISNGVIIQNTTNGVVTNLNGGTSIKNNSGYAGLTPNLNIKTFVSNNDFLTAEILFDTTAISLNGNNNDKLEVILNDDFAALLNHTFLAIGADVTNMGSGPA